MRGYCEGVHFSEEKVMYRICDKCGGKFYIDGEIDVFALHISSVTDLYSFDEANYSLDIDLCEHCTIMALEALRDIGITCGETNENI